MKKLRNAFNTLCLRVYFEYINTMYDMAESIEKLRRDIRFKIAQWKIERGR